MLYQTLSNDSFAHSHTHTHANLLSCVTLIRTYSNLVATRHAIMRLDLNPWCVFKRLTLTLILCILNDF